MTIKFKMLHQAIVIVGGGPVGLSLALLLAQQGKKVVVIEAAINKDADGRVLALSYASYLVLQQLQAWPEGTTAIDSVQISHRGLGVSQIKAQAIDLPHLGYTVAYAALCEQLIFMVKQQANITLISAAVTAVYDDANFVTITYQIADTLNYLTADVVILAEGGKLLAANPSKVDYDYKQHALVAHMLMANKVTPGVACERFTPVGPLVLLPHQEHYVMVWSLAHKLALEFKHEPALLVAALNREFTDRLGGAKLISPVHSFPIRLSQAKRRVLQRVVLVGNSAQMLHPVSAQGLNLGLRDVVVLGEILAKTEQIEVANLQEFDLVRKKDATTLIGFTHYLALFLMRQNKLTQYLCSSGIIALSNLPRVQNYLARSLIFGF